MSKPTLLHRGYLYAQKRVAVPAQQLFAPSVAPLASEIRMRHAATWRAGYLAAQVDARRRIKRNAKNR